MNSVDRGVINTLRPRQNVRRFADDTFKRIFLNENVWKSIKISLKFVPKVPINNIPALVQIMAWRRPGYKPLSEPMVVSLPTHICVARPQWVKSKPALVQVMAWLEIVKKSLPELIPLLPACEWCRFFKASLWIHSFLIVLGKCLWLYAYHVQFWNLLSHHISKHSTSVNPDFITLLMKTTSVKSWSSSYQVWD